MDSHSFSICVIKQVFYYDLMKNAISLYQDDGIGEVLYDTKWYTLSIEQQKIVMHLINRKQNGTALTMGPFAQLNMGTVSIVSVPLYFAVFC